MPLTISNNPSSLIAQNNLGKSNVAFKQSLERLSSGLKINRGADGPAALVISEKQRAQIAGLNAAINNSEKAVALIQTAEGALSEINSLLVKIRSLAIDSGNSGVNDEDALAANQAEIDNALDTINRIANNTQFGTKKLLDGSAGINGVASVPAQVTFLKATATTTAGTYTVDVTTAGERAVATAGVLQTAALAANEILTINGEQVQLTAGMTQTDVITTINTRTSVTGVVADAGGAGGELRLYSEVFGADETISVISNTTAAATSTGIGTTAITDSGVDIQANIGSTAVSGRGNTLTVGSGLAEGLSLSVGQAADAVTTFTGANGNITINDKSLTFQIGPNANQSASIAVGKANPSSLGIGAAGNQFANLGQINVTTAAKANDTLAIVDSAIDDITNLRGDLGAFQQNTLMATANNLRVTLENTINAESVIRDTDFAAEIAEFTKQQVLMQAGTSTLSNANQLPQLVLSLLGS